MAEQPLPRRRFQFRLRTLFVVVTLFAVASWVVTDRARLIRERDEAIERSHDRREVEAWMALTHAEEQEAARYRSMLSAEHTPPARPATQP